MGKTYISTKILTIVAAVAGLGVLVFIAVLAMLLEQDFVEQFDDSLSHFSRDSADLLTNALEDHDISVGRLTSDIENSLKADRSLLDYWDEETKADFLVQRYYLDLYSSVFVASSSKMDYFFLKEVAQTGEAWKMDSRDYEHKLMSISYISELGFVRTQPSHRAAFFPPEYDPRESHFFKPQLPNADSGRRWGVQFDPLNEIYVLTFTEELLVDGVRRGVVVAVYEFPFKFLVTEDSNPERFQPRLVLLDKNNQVLARPFVSRENQQVPEYMAVLLDRLEQAQSLPDLQQGKVASLDAADERFRYTSLGLGYKGWKLVAYYPEAFLEARLNKVYRSLILVLVSGGVALTLFCYMGLRLFVSRPLRRLLKATEAIPANQWRYHAPKVHDDEIGELSGAISLVSDELRHAIAQQQKTIASLDNMSKSLSSMYSTLDASDNMTAIMEPNWQIIYSNERFQGIFGAGAVDGCFQEIYKQVIDDLGEDHFQRVEHALRTRPLWQNEIRIAVAGEEEPRSYSEKIFAHCDDQGEWQSIIYSAQALFQKQVSAEEVHRLAYYDHLTGLQNRTFFKGVMDKELSSLNRSEAMLALLYLDLDNFKTINDSMGHEAGDKLLIEVSERLRDCLRGEDAIARLGGDEFAILLTDVDALHYVSIVANKIIQSLNRPLSLDGQVVSIRASIGVTVAPHDGNEASELLKNADLAMYQAKDKGKNNFRFFTQDMNRVVSRRLELEQDIKQALDNQEFVLFYQPKIHLKTGKVHSAEALVRWQLPSGEIRGPMDFIPAAEECGLILDLGLWILKTACQQAKTLYKALRQKVVISVNVSARQLIDPDFVNQVAQVLDEIGLESSLLELEITESLFMTNLDQTISHLEALRELGVRISIDDFGTGYSSLSYLKRLPIDQLKVDRSFIMDLPDDEDDRVITELIISMAKQLSLEVVAEGVETEEQFLYLNNLDCEYIQGYYFARPLPTDQFMVYVFDQASKPQGVFEGSYQI